LILKKFWGISSNLSPDRPQTRMVVSCDRFSEPVTNLSPHPKNWLPKTVSGLTGVIKVKKYITFIAYILLILELALCVGLWYLQHMDTEYRQNLSEQNAILRDIISDQQTVISQQEVYRVQANILADQVQELQTRIESIMTDLAEVTKLTDRAGDSSRGMDEPIIATVTAYDLSECGKEPGHPEYGITASGRPVREWYTCAAAPMFPFGTVLYIPYFKDAPNRGVFVVEDRGSGVVDNGRYGPCVDIYLKEHDEVEAFGGKALEVYVLRMGD